MARTPFRQCQLEGREGDGSTQKHNTLVRHGTSRGLREQDWACEGGGKGVWRLVWMHYTTAQWVFVAASSQSSTCKGKRGACSCINCPLCVSFVAMEEVD